MRAVYGGVCPICDNPIRVGDEITLFEGEWGHVRCPQTLRGEICPVHFLERALDGSCEECDS